MSQEGKRRAKVKARGKPKATLTLKPDHSPYSSKSLKGLEALRESVLTQLLSVEPETVQSISSDSTIRLSKSSDPAFDQPEAELEGDMAARNRPRNGAIKDEDAHEELSMWEQIKRDLEKCAVIQKRAREVSAKIVEMEEKIGKAPTIKEIDELQALYRENVKLAEDEHRMLNEEPADLIKNIGILQALRTASEAEPPRQHHAVNPPKMRKQKSQAPKLESTLDGVADSPVPSPSVSTSATSRLKGSSTARSGSVASVREAPKEVPAALPTPALPTPVVATAPTMPSVPIVKIEQPDNEDTKGPLAERAGKFFVGAEVAYKQSKVKEDGSQWIQCNIIKITESGGKRRYDVQDPEPDENGAPGQIFVKASAGALIAIPRPGVELGEVPVGKTVLARYPETTTFYRAEVTGVRGGVCRLKFEDDQNQEMEVDRRFVLEMGGK